MTQTADSTRAQDMVDWDLAVQTARRMVRPGPQVSRTEAADVVAELRRGAMVAETHVRDYTGLHAQSATAPVVVVDRPGWIQANADGFREIMAPLVRKVRETRGEPSPLVTSVGSRLTGLEAGGLLSFLASKVLGQFDPFWPAGGTADSGRAGRMLLVAPNIVHVERELEADSHDFRLWVCLHEETHRVQFTAVPWMREHVQAEIGRLLEATEIDPARIAAMVKDGLAAVGRAVRGDTEVSLLDLVQTPEQKVVVDRLTAVMSLLEGHADVVMDGVGPDVVPTVETIRKRFGKRRAGGSPMDQVLRRLLGLEAKYRQYRDGASFVRGVEDKVGRDGFNAVWTSPQTLPSPEEIADPAGWVRRVHG